MPVQFDKEVWVVSLGKRLVAPGSAVRLCDVPGKFGVYIFPETYNPRKTRYIAFRFDGQLQGVHRILDVRSPVSSYREVIPAFDAKAPTGQPCVVYDLGPAIPLGKTVKSGKMRDRRTYCDLDLLLTSETVLEASQFTKERREQGL